MTSTSLRRARGIQAASKLQSSVPTVQSCREMLIYVLDVRCNARPAPQLYRCLSCHSGHLIVRPLCGFQKMGLIEALLGSAAGLAYAVMKALNSTVLYNGCFPFVPEMARVLRESACGGFRPGL